MNYLDDQREHQLSGIVIASLQKDRDAKFKILADALELCIKEIQGPGFGADGYKNAGQVVETAKAALKAAGR